MQHNVPFPTKDELGFAQLFFAMSTNKKKITFTNSGHMFVYTQLPKSNFHDH